MKSDMGFAWQKVERRIALIVLLAIFGLESVTVWAGINSWTSHGPEVGMIFALAVDPKNPGTVYAGTSRGVFKTTDGGKIWSAANSGLPSPTFVGALAVDLQNPNIVYAGIYSGISGGLFKSTDGGISWSAANSGLAVDLVNTLAIDPQNLNTVYAGSDSREIFTSRGLFKSTNGGMSWGAANSGLAEPATYVSALAVDPQNPSTVYAGTWGGVFKSTNAAGSWSTANFGLSAPFVLALALDPQNPSTIYAGAFDGEVFKSTDGGESWSAVSSGLPGTDISALAVDPQNSNTVYAGTGGYMGTGGGVFKSTNGAASWSGLSSGLTNLSVSSLAIDPQNPSRVYAGTLGGVFEITFASPELTLNATEYCVGASWSLKVSNASANTAIRLLGTSNGQSWEIAEWRKTDANGSFSEEGTFADGTEGSYTLRVEIGGVISNTVPFAVSNCKRGPAPTSGTSRP